METRPTRLRTPPRQRTRVLSAYRYAPGREIVIREVVSRGSKRVRLATNGEGAIRSYQDLRVWKKSMDLAEICYRVTTAFPNKEVYAMTSQIRRAAASVPANIAEGFGRETPKEFVRFLRIAQGSLKELETHLILASRVGLSTCEKTGQLLEECEKIGKMLQGLIRSLREKASQS